MRSDSGRTTSLWMATADVPECPTLLQNAKCEVCIVGAGIAGLTTAYQLGVAGRRVVVLDDGPIGGGETGRTTAHITAALDDRYYEIEKIHDLHGSRVAADSHAAAIERIDQIVRDERIDCDFVRLDGYLFLGGDSTVQELKRELEAVHRAGLRDVELVPRAPITSFDTGPALRFPRQAQFHPIKYLAGLARAIERQGGRIFTNTHAEEMRGGPLPTVKTSDGMRITCDVVVVCTNTPVNDWVTIHTKQAPYRTYVIGARIPTGSVPVGLYWDTPDPYHYIRVEGGGGRPPGQGAYDVLIVGGEDHKTGQADDAESRWHKLEEWTRERFPMVQGIEYRWSGQVIEPVDYMGFIGRNPGGDENIYIATGDSGNGMTHGTIAGMLITDLITGKHSPWKELYDPARITASRDSVLEFVKENLNVAAQYRDYITPGEVSSPDMIAPGEGAVMRRGRKKIAVYKDEAGSIHEMSAVCTHLYCIVDWNTAEKTWDCPCHGSRFDPYGHVVNGPAVSGLEPVGELEEARGKKK
jgi:glycine/D-amino acid oxidase-like deaminating enzyme/nitrite reductase/ring-hydroxylating ferredoxin subunit